MAQAMSLSLWTHWNPVTIAFGWGVRRESISTAQNAHYLLVCSMGTRQRLEKEWRSWVSGSARMTVMDTVAINPDLDQLDNLANEYRSRDFDAIIAVGGGSAIDTAKALSALLADPGFALGSHFRQKTALPADPWLPVIAFPTTAGTGSEVTPTATIWDNTGLRKWSLLGPEVFPRHAVVDPELTISMPEDVTVSTGLDALTHALESIWNRSYTPVTDALAQRALVEGWRALQRVVEAPADSQARTAMSLTGVLAGLAISQTRTALCHAISYPLTLHHGVPHGLACGFTMEAVLRFNMEWDDGRLANLATALGFRSLDGLAKGALDLLKDLDVGARVAGYVQHGLQELLALTPEMCATERTGNNNRPVTQEDICRILERAWISLAK